jgi:hypothetical protein
MSSVKLSEERFSQPATVCPQGYYFGCSRYGCSCRKKLSTGAIIGIVAGIVGFLIIAAIVMFFVSRKYNSSQKYTTTPKYVSSISTPGIGAPGYGPPRYGSPGTSAPGYGPPRYGATGTGV